MLPFERSRLTQKTATPSEVKSEVDPSGLGIGLGLAVFGLVLPLVAVLLPLDEGWLTTLWVGSVGVTTIGVGGAMLETGKHLSRSWFADLSTALVLFGVGSVLLLLHVRCSLFGWMHVLLVLLLIGVACFAFVGLGVGLAKAVQSPVRTRGGTTSDASLENPANKPEPLRRGERIAIWVAVICTLVQCSVSIAIAVLAPSGSG